MDSTTLQMLALLRASLAGQKPDPLPATEEEWQKLFRLARKHAVVTMINDAIEQLPADLRPQGDIAISWALSADRTRYHFHHQEKVLADIRRRATDDGLQTVVVKGLSLAACYPVPSSRACGDIDLFFEPREQDAYRRGNALLGNADAQCDGKHAEFLVDGVSVENHYTLLDQNYRSQRRAERYIRSTIKDITPDGCLSPMGNMAYLLMHTISHITAKFKLPLRNVLDWGMFLKANRDRLDPAECHRVMRRIGMDDAFNMLTLLSAEFIGADLATFISGKIRQDDVDKMRELILDKSYLAPVPAGLPFFQRLRTRYRRNRQRRWLYRYLPSTGLERLCGNLIRLVHKDNG